MVGRRNAATNRKNEPPRNEGPLAVVMHSGDDWRKRARPLEGKLFSEGRGSGNTGRVVRDGGRVVVYPDPVTNLPERTTSKDGNEVVVGTGDTGKNLEMVMVDEVVSPRLTCRRKWC